MKSTQFPNGHPPVSVTSPATSRAASLDSDARRCDLRLRIGAGWSFANTLLPSPPLTHQESIERVIATGHMSASG
jgi:hypothetical protein